MLGLRILDFVCLDQLIQERTVFRNIGFFRSFFGSWIIPIVSGLVFLDLVLVFLWIVGSGFCLDIGVLVNQSI